MRQILDLLKEHVNGYTDPKIGGVIGETVFYGPDFFVWQIIKKSQFLNSFSFATRMQNAPWGPCSNISYLKTVLNEVQGFKEDWPLKLGGDDADLGLRVNNMGLLIKCCPAAIVYHTNSTWSSFSAVLERAFRWGRMDYHLYYVCHSSRLKRNYFRFTNNLLVLVILSLVMSIFWGVAFLFLPVVWAALTVAAQGVMTAKDKGDATFNTSFQEMLADLLGLGFEFGTYYESFRYGDLRPVFLSVERGPVQKQFRSREWLIQKRAQYFITVLLAFLLGIIFLR